MKNKDQRKKIKEKRKKHPPSFHFSLHSVTTRQDGVTNPTSHNSPQKKVKNVEG